MSVARSLRSAIEEAVGPLPDIIALIIGIAVVVYFIRPILGITGQIKDLIGGSPSTMSTTGTIGGVHATPALYGYAVGASGYTPIKKFFQQMISERQI